MSNPNKNDVKAQEKASERVSIDDALRFLVDFKEWLLKAANTEVLLEGDYTVKAIRAIDRAIGYINWARGILKQRFSNSNFNRSYMQSFKSYKKAYYPKKTYSKPYSKRKFYGGGRKWSRRY